jgi:NAD(P)H-dependent FMN reductase
VNVHAISGSLRRLSTNNALLQLLRAEAPREVTVTIEEGLTALPYFNPDHDGESDAVDENVRAFRERVHAADVLVFSTPEYAHGVPGVLKNALDWLVSDTNFPGKPVAALHASPYGAHARASLLETLRVMSATILDDCCMTIAVQRSDVDEIGAIQNERLKSEVRRFGELLVRRVR